MDSSSSQRRRRSTRRPPQVFISFRGVDVRDNLVKHLVNTLKFEGINVFIDAFLPKGMQLQKLFTKIEESKIAVVIFSKRFTDSDWCMDELVKMDEREKQGKLVVLPVFYEVTTSDVKNLRGVFGEGFEKLKQDKEPEKVQKWEAAVESIAGIDGFPPNVNGKVAPPLVHQIAHAIEEILKDMPGGKIRLPKPKKTITDVALEAFVAAILWAFFISPRIFNNAECFMTPQWLFGFPTLVVLFNIYNGKANNNPPPGNRPPTTPPPS